MDFDAFKKQLDAARSLTCTVEGIEFTLTLPTEYDMAAANEDYRDSQGRPNNVRAMRGLLLQSVGGWKGATTKHVLPTATEESLDFSYGALGALLDARQDIVASLVGEILMARQTRLKRQEEAAKN